jgi:hypothetical protein
MIEGEREEKGRKVNVRENEKEKVGDFDKGEWEEEGRKVNVSDSVEGRGYGEYEE